MAEQLHYTTTETKLCMNQQKCKALLPANNSYIKLCIYMVITVMYLSQVMGMVVVVVPSVPLVMREGESW